MNYSPNLKDPRVIERVKHAYVFTKIIQGHRTQQNEYNLSQTLIDKHFGQSQTNLSKWLRKNLLTCVNHGYSIEAHVTKKYKINETGSAIIRRALKDGIVTESINYKKENSNPANIRFDDKLVKEVVQRDYANELSTGNFTYTDKSGRLWHPIQNVKRESKKQILAESGYKWQYDIEACAPTLILQHAQHLGMDEYLFAINDYLKNKDARRNDIAELADVPLRTAKVVINALFCGARLGATEEFALFHELQCDESRVIVLREDEFITNLRADIKTCWDTIKTTMQRRTTIDKNGNTRRIPISSRQRWGRYFDLERQVLNAIKKFLKKTDNKHFTEHDGWACERQVDEVALKAFIKSETGFDVNFSKEELVRETVKSERDTLLRMASVTSSVLSFANAHSDTDSLQSATPNDRHKHYTNHSLTHTPLLYITSPSKPINEIKSPSATTWIAKYFRDKQHKLVNGITK